MASAWRFFVDSGLKPDLPDFLQDRLRISNVIGVILGIFVGIGFVIISYFFAPQLTIYPALGAVTTLPCFLYNRLGFRRLSRFFIASVPAILGLAYNASLTGEGQTPILGVALITLGFSTLPIVVFSVREMPLLVLTLGLNACMVIFFPYYKHFFYLGEIIDREVFDHGWLNEVMVSLSLLISFSNIFMLVGLNRKNSRALELTLKEAYDKNEALEKSQIEAREAIEQLEETQVLEKGRQWVVEGNSEVNSLLRENQTDLSKGYNRLISFIVKYLEAQQGAIFEAVESLQEPGEFTLRQKGGFALGKERYRGKEFQAGEGLVGTVYVEGEAQVLESLPKGFMTISSGLGEDRPVSVAIFPMKVEGRVEGVLEVYSFRVFTQVQRDFLERVSDTIGSYIGIARVNERTKELLETSLQQAEELRAQEEEMRQNTEELLATQEEMKRKEKEYLKEIERLRKL
ncbi:MAG: GAF domain-containing protein [Bacteroidota bacterium]